MITLIEPVGQFHLFTVTRNFHYVNVSMQYGANYNVYECKILIFFWLSTYIVGNYSKKYPQSMYKSSKNEKKKYKLL